VRGGVRTLNRQERILSSRRGNEPAGECSAFSPTGGEGGIGLGGGEETSGIRFLGGRDVFFSGGLVARGGGKESLQRDGRVKDL